MSEPTVSLDVWNAIMRFRDACAAPAFSATPRDGYGLIERDAAHEAYESALDRLRLAIAAGHDAMRQRAERAEATLRTRIDREYRAAFAADYHARAVLAAERAGIHPTRRDGRVDLGIGAGQGGGA